MPDTWPRETKPWAWGTLPEQTCHHSGYMSLPKGVSSYVPCSYYDTLWLLGHWSTLAYKVMFSCMVVCWTHIFSHWTVSMMSFVSNDHCLINICRGRRVLCSCFRYGCWSFTLTMWGDGVFGGWLFHEGWAIMTEIRVLMKKVSGRPLTPFTVTYVRKCPHPHQTPN